MKNILHLFIYLSLFVTSSIAAGDFTNGTGTNTNPFMVESYADLKNVGNNLTAFYKLSNDIIADDSKSDNGDAGFEPIGTATVPFNGHFNGAGFKIKNLFINRGLKNNIGLFAAIGDTASVDSLGLTGVITGQNKTGCIAGANYGLITESYSSCTVTGQNIVGGIVGDGGSGKIVNSYNHGNIQGVNSVGGVGGVTAKLDKCVNTGNVHGSYSVGGLGGYAAGSISSSYNVGAITGGIASGGLVGYYESGMINTSYNTGDVIGTRFSGGLVGTNDFGQFRRAYNQGAVTGTQYVGGIVGYTTAGTVRDVYNTGLIKGDADQGGLIGFSDASGVQNGFWDFTTSGITTSDGGTAKLTSVMFNEATFDTWEFGTIWVIDEGLGYPQFKNVNEVPKGVRDTVTVSLSLDLNNLLDNDTDDITQSLNLIVRVDTLYGIGSTDSSTYFTFPAGTIDGVIDSLKYSVGELLPNGMVLWGHSAVAILIKNFSGITLHRDTLSGKEDVLLEKLLSLPINVSASIGVIPQNGLAEIRNDSLFYLGNDNWFGIDSLTIIKTDGMNFDTTLFLILVEAVNDAPTVLKATTLETLEETALTIDLSAITTNDAEGDTLTLVMVDSALYSIDGNTITPDLNVTGLIDLYFYVDDGTAQSTLSHLTITVLNVDDSPALNASDTPIITAETDLLQGLFKVSVIDDDSDDISIVVEGTDADKFKLVNDSLYFSDAFTLPEVEQNLEIILIATADNISDTIALIIPVPASPPIDDSGKGSSDLGKDTVSIIDSNNVTLSDSMLIDDTSSLAAPKDVGEEPVQEKNTLIWVKEIGPVYDANGNIIQGGSENNPIISPLMTEIDFNDVQIRSTGVVNNSMYSVLFVLYSIDGRVQERFTIAPSGNRDWGVNQGQGQFIIKYSIGYRSKLRNFIF